MNNTATNIWYEDPARIHFTWMLVLWHTVPVVACLVFYTACDMLPAVFGRFKIQRTSSNLFAMALSAETRAAYNVSNSQRLHGATFLRAVGHFTLNHFVVIPLLWFCLGYDLALRRNPTFITEPWPGARTAAAHMLVCVMCEDTLFYWAHRLLHTTLLYRAVHKRHHEFHVPFSLAAEYAHPVESLLGNFLPFLAGPVLCGSSLHELCLWFVIRMVKTAEAHSGYGFPLAPFSIFPAVMVSARQHDFHHSNNKGCFGSFFNAWDWICGTDEPFRIAETKRTPQ
jgi:sterol desaturase/sphingolipid hydroxylase (fatty acid hydroxylase superfamily)